MSVSRTPLLATRFAPIDFQPAPRTKRVFVDAALSGMGTSQLFRYASLPEALAVLHTGAFGFAHPSSWTDHYETRLAEALARDPAGHTVFARSFTTNFASEALWQLYRRDLSVVRIGIKLNGLLAALDEAGAREGFRTYLARARYLPPAAFNRALRERAGADAPADVASLLAMKRQGFEYENEVRVIVFPDTPRATPYFGITLPASLEIASLLLDPYLEDWQFQPLARALEDWTERTVRQSNFAGKARR